MINRDKVTLVEIMRWIDMSRFKPRMADAMIYHYCEMMSISDTARLIGVSRQAVSRAKYRLERVAMMDVQ